MMKKIVSVGLVGLGVLAAQGCSVDAGDEQIGFEQDALTPAQCLDAQGAKATVAALAVAMGDELGRWDPLNDLQIVKEGYFYFTRLKPSAVCLKNACKNTKAILGQQDFSIDQNRFNSGNYRSNLENSFSRETNLMTNLRKNNPTKVPPAHKLTKVAGPTDLGVGACGAHFVFQVDHIDGTPLTTTEAANMANTLCFYGQDSPYAGCGGNTFIGFTQTQVGCPTGRMCVAIDPDPNDDGTVTTTTPGAAPVYPMNRVLDPGNVLLNTACATTLGKAGKMLSKCTTMPTTCGYLYCTPN